MVEIAFGDDPSAPPSDFKIAEMNLKEFALRPFPRINFPEIAADRDLARS
jgi:hypothetical protein